MAVAQEASHATWSSLSVNVQLFLTKQPTWCWAVVLHNHWHAGVVAAWPAFAADGGRVPALVLEIIRLPATQKAGLPEV